MMAIFRTADKLNARVLKRRAETDKLLKRLEREARKQVPGYQDEKYEWVAYVVMLALLGSLIYFG